MFMFDTLTKFKIADNGDTHVDVHPELDMKTLVPIGEADPELNVKAEPFFPDVVKEVFKVGRAASMAIIPGGPAIVPGRKLAIDETEKAQYETLGRALNIPQQALFAFTKEPGYADGAGTSDIKELGWGAVRAIERGIKTFTEEEEPIRAEELYKDIKFKPLTLGLNIPFVPVPIRMDVELNEKQVENLVTMYTDIFANPLYLTPLAVRTVRKIANINWGDIATRIKYGKIPKMPAAEKVFTPEELNAVFGSAAEKKAYMEKFGVPAWKNLAQFAGEYNSLLSGVIPEGGTVFFSGIPIDGKSIREIAKTLKISAPIVEKIAKGIEVAGLSQGIIDQVKTALNEFVPKAGVAEVAAEPLLAEALKYKTAGEYVKAQGTPVYRGQVDAKVYEDMTYFTTDRTYAESFADPDNPQIVESVISPKKILDLTDLGVRDITASQFIKFAEDKGVKLTDQSKEAIRSDIKDKAWYFMRRSGDTMKRAIKDAGYDAVSQYENITGGKDRKLAIISLDKNNIKTKSELTDIWNKAQEAPKQAEIPPKLPRGEEIVPEAGVIPREVEIVPAEEQILEDGTPVVQLDAPIRDYTKALEQARKIRKAKSLTKQEIKKVQKQITESLKDSELDKLDRGKFLDTVRSIQTKKQYDKAMPKIEARVERLIEAGEKRKLSEEIKKELKYTKPVKSGQRIVGKYDYESNKFFEDVRSAWVTTQIEAQNAIDKLPTENLTEIDLIRARLLSLKANGASASVALHKAVLADIQRLKTLGAAAKDDADFEKRLAKGERIVELSQALDKVKILPGESAYLLGISNHWSLLNALGGKNIADKYDPELLQNRVTSDIYQTTTKDNATIADILDLDSPKDVPKYFSEMEKTEYVVTGAEDTKHTISKNHILHIYNGLKNDMIRDRWYNAFGEQQITDMVDKLTPQEKEVADYWMDNLQQYRPILNERNIEITGRDMGFIENYWPAVSEHEPSVYDDMMMQGETPSAMKNRVVSSKITPIPARASMIYKKHLEQAEHIKQLSRRYETLRRLFTNPKIKNQIVNKFGDKIYALVKRRIEDISLNKKTAELDAIDSAYSFFLNNWIAAKITSPSVFLTQLGSVINYAENMTPGEWASGFFEGIMSPKETFDYMWKNLPFLETRFNRGYSEVVREAIKNAGTIGEHLMGDWRKGLSILTRSGDVAAIIYGGYPYFKQLIKEHGIEKARDIFEAVSLKAQQSPMTTGLSEAQKSRSGFTRTLMAFKNTPTQYLRKLVDSIISYNNGDMSKEQLAKNILIYTILNPIIYATSKAPWWVGTSLVLGAIGAAIRGEKLEKPDIKEIGTDIVRNALVSLASSPFGAIPVVDDIAKAVAAKAIKDKAPYQVMTLPLISDLEMVIKKMLTKKELTLMDYLASLGSVGEMGTGIPFTQGFRLGKSFVGDGKTPRERAFDKKQEKYKEKRKKYEEKLKANKRKRGK